MEYRVLFCTLKFKKDIDKVEQIQRWAARMMKELETISYENRLNEMNMFSLEKSWLREYMITI